MNKGKVIQRRDGLYIARIIIGGKLYEYEADSKKKAEDIIKKKLKENPIL